MGEREQAAAKVAEQYGAKPIWSKQPGGMIGLQFSAEDAKKLQDAGYENLGKLSSGNYSTNPSYLAKFKAAAAGGGPGAGLLTPKAVKVGQSLGKWKVTQASEKRITIFMPGDLGAKLNKPLSFNWDGTGFKRQGQYLTPSGDSVSADKFKKSLEGVEDMTDEMEKAKYKSKKRVGNRWVYDYGEKKGTGGGGAKQEPWANFTQDQMGDLQEAVMGGDKKKYESMTGQKWEDRPKEWGGGKGAGAKPAGGKNTQGGKLPEPKVSTIGNATLRDYGSLGLTRTQGGYHAALDAEGTELGEYGSLAEAQNKLLSMKKSLDGQTGLEDWLQKSGGLPTHEPKLGAGKSAAVEGGSADGGEVAGVGMTSGSSDSSPGPGQDGSGQLKGVGTGSKQKLSEDDADEEKQMSTHKKPIETVRKSRFPADQRSSVAHETAQRVSQLQKSEDVYLGPDAHPLSHVRQHGGADNAASELVKSEGFYHGMSPQTARPSVPLGQGVLCKSIHAGGCETVYTAALTACPDCGAGTVGHRALPGGVVMGAETEILEKSEGHGNLLRPRPQEPDVKIGD